MNIFHKRQGQMDSNTCYFYTDSIYQFHPLLKDDNLKSIIIYSWKYLVQLNLVETYGYVIMPNHIHLLWSMLDSNGKESPAGSFAKYTAHQFKKYLDLSDKKLLQTFKSNKIDRAYQFWKRDPLAVPISTEDIFIQKLAYIHNNPVKQKWSLAIYPENYRWSSAAFYLSGYDEFGILTHYKR